MIGIILTVVAVYLITGKSLFWPWMASRSFPQLLLITIILTLLVWAAVNIAGLGPK